MNDDVVLVTVKKGWHTLGGMGRYIRFGSLVEGGHGGAGQGARGEGARLVKGYCGAPHQSVQHIATLYQDPTAPSINNRRHLAEDRYKLLCQHVGLLM